MKLQGQITLLVERDYTTIRIEDDTSNAIICEVRLTPGQLSSALSRMADTPCDVDVFPQVFDRFGKKMEVQSHEFPLPDGFVNKHSSSNVALVKIAQQTAPDGWTADDYFNSQNSFFTKDGQKYARCHIRRWVNIM